MVVSPVRPDIAIPDKPFHEMICDRLTGHQKNLAIINNSTNQSTTYEQLIWQINKLAVSLQNQGLAKGDVVAVLSLNCAEFVVVNIAVMKCGAIVTAANPYYKANEITSQWRDCNPKFVFCDQNISTQTMDIINQFPSVKDVFTFYKHPTYHSLKTLLNSNTSGMFKKVPVDVANDTALLLYSSGTTGLPKGVMLTHRTVLSSVLLFQSAIPHLQSDTTYIFVPTFHAFGWLQIMMCLFAGCKVVCDQRFNMDRMLAAIEKYNISVILAAPPVINAIMDSDTSNYNTNSVRKVLTGGAPLHKIDDIKTKFKNANLGQAYGTTESLIIATTDFIGTPIYSAGTLLANTLLKVIDTETMKECGQNQPGEFWISGPQVMLGYLNRPEATNDCIVDGWFRTGDIGYFDEKNFLFILDRLKEFIKYKGFQVAPAELEAILTSHPQIQDAAVVGIPNHEAGEVPRAFVVPIKESTLTVEQIHSFVNDRVVSYKRLRGGVEYIDVIPRSPSGKTLRKNLKAKIVQANQSKATSKL